MHRVRASFSFHTTAVCLDWCAFLVEVSTFATFSEGISQECHSSSKSSPDREIKGKRERWESFHFKHPLMKCSRIQLLYPPKTLPLSRFQPNRRLITIVLSCVFVSCVLKRWRGKECSRQEVMAIAAVVSEHVTWMFCDAFMHLFGRSACFIRISTHISFRRLSCCCSVGKL